MNSIDPEVTEMVNDLSATANAWRQSIVLLTANRYDLFTHLSGKLLTAKQVAEGMRWDGRACEVLLNALTSTELLKKEGGCFSNSEMAERLLVKDSPDYQGDILNHNLNLWERWSRIGEVLKSGLPLRDPEKPRSPEEQRHFINGMANIARYSAEKLWDRIDLSGNSRLLDAGGGPGTYSFAASRRFPNLECVVFDLPEVEPIFQEHHSRTNVGQKVSFYAGNLHEGLFPGKFDTVLLSNIIHSWGEDENRILLQKMNETMDNGGLLLIKDFFISEDGTKSLFAALFTVNMLVSTPSGRCFSREEVKAWLESVDFKYTDFIELTEQAGVIVAQKTG